MPYLLKFHPALADSIRRSTRRELVCAALRQLARDIASVDNPRDLPSYGTPVSEKPGFGVYGVELFCRIDDASETCEIIAFST